jgi:NAD(P)-dependent dehydrogenase (short-subunit alcohol dehydrogenase family)
VNNLGIYEAVGFFDESDESWLRLFEVNIMSGVRLSRHYLQRMLARGTGRIVFMSSESGLNPAPEMAHYSATKTMQLAISRSLAELTKGTKVTVNSVLPGSTKTEGVKAFVCWPLSEGVRAVRRDERIDEIAGALINKPRIQTNDIRDIRQPAQGVVCELREPPERVGDAGDFVNVVGIAVRQRRDLADGVGEGDDAQVVVVSERDGIAVGIEQLRQEDFA